MPKFKVGDKVRLDPSKTEFKYGRAGVSFREVGTVTHVVHAGGAGDYRVLFKSHGGGWAGLESEFIPYTKSTQKPKEPKTMTATKKPGTSHGKPTAKGVKVEKKPTAAKVSKYPAPRVQRELIAEAKPLEKRTKDQLIATAQDLAVQFHNLAADHCIAGTKLDRALVDLKEAKKRIKELTKGTGAAK